MKLKSSKITFALTILLAFALSSCEWEKKDPQAAAEAKKVAQKWLVYVDTGNYLGSYHISDKYLQGYFERQKWQEYLLMFRMPLGEILDRRIKKEYFSSSIPGLLQGQFYILECETDFSRRNNVYEKITVIKGKDGKWRVGGYQPKWREPQPKTRKLF